jgi:hypothetical protein
VFAPGLIQGRWVSCEDFEALQRLIAEHPHWSRRRLSIALCEALNWRTASGQLKDMSARLLLNKLAERECIKLPPRQSGGGRQVLRALSEPELFTLSVGTEGAAKGVSQRVSQQFLTKGLFLRVPRSLEWIAKGGLLKPRTNGPRDWCSYSKTEPRNEGQVKCCGPKP